MCEFVRCELCESDPDMPRTRKEDNSLKGKMKARASENLSGLIEELECQCRHSIDIVDIGRPRALWHTIKIGAFEKTRISQLKCCMLEITGLRGPRY